MSRLPEKRIQHTHFTRLLSLFACTSCLILRERYGHLATHSGWIDLLDTIRTDDSLQDEYYYTVGITYYRAHWRNTETGAGILYRYNGKELNKDLGLYAFGARYYDPTIARFTGGDPIADQFPHVSTYNYADNEPIANIDFHGLQAVSFQIAARIGGRFDLIPGPIVSGAVGIAIHKNLDVLLYHTESLGSGVGAFAGMGGEITFNFGAENIDGLLGWGLNVEGVAEVSPLGGSQFGVEGNYTQATDTSLEGLGVPISDGDDDGGFSAAIPEFGKAVGFFAYADASYTSKIDRFSGEDALLTRGRN